MLDLNVFEQTLGLSFHDKSLLEQSLVHSSYVNENPGLNPISNERLEFLGDAVLGVIIAQKLFEDFPRSQEGQMTKLRAALVRRDTLARVATSIGLDRLLYLGKGEEASGGRSKPANLAGAMEALIAAVFLDQGLSFTRELVLRLFDPEMRRAVSEGTETDYKSELQEFVQARQQRIPNYRIVEVTGPDHDKTFTVEVMVGDMVMGRSSGKSKKAAESEAAQQALKQLQGGFTG